VPTLAYAANSAWQQLVALTHNLLTNFQIDTGASGAPIAQAHRPPAPCDRTDTALHTLSSSCGIRAVRAAGPSRLTNNPATERLFTRIERTLPRAALGFCRIRVNYAR